MDNLALLPNRQGKYERAEEMHRPSAEPKKKRKGQISVSQFPDGQMPSALFNS
jgi:hypothetical protein